MLDPCYLAKVNLAIYAAFKCNFGLNPSARYWWCRWPKGDLLCHFSLRTLYSEALLFAPGQFTSAAMVRLFYNYGVYAALVL